jgi:predicted metallopeptidase
MLRKRFERRWQPGQLPEAQLCIAPTGKPGFHFTDAMAALAVEVSAGIPELRQIDMSRVLVTGVVSRNRSKYGVQARVTPMRFKEGSLTRRRHGVLYGITRYYVGDREVLYLLSFVLPRFLNLPFEEKLATLVHELYHMSPAFDGDLRRFGGRVHAHSKEDYHRGMIAMAEAYRQRHGDSPASEFLKWNYQGYQDLFGGVRAVVVPCPRLVPISSLSSPS